MALRVYRLNQIGKDRPPPLGERAGPDPRWGTRLASGHCLKASNKVHTNPQRRRGNLANSRHPSLTLRVSVRRSRQDAPWRSFIHCIQNNRIDQQAGAGQGMAARPGQRPHVLPRPSLPGERFRLAGSRSFRISASLSGGEFLGARGRNSRRDPCQCYFEFVYQRL